MVDKEAIDLEILDTVNKVGYIPCMSLHNTICIKKCIFVSCSYVLHWFIIHLVIFY